MNLIPYIILCCISTVILSNHRNFNPEIWARAQQFAQTADRIYSRGYLKRVADADDRFIDAFYECVGIYEPTPECIARPLPGRIINFDRDGYRIMPVRERKRKQKP